MQSVSLFPDLAKFADSDEKVLMPAHLKGRVT